MRQFSETTCGCSKKQGSPCSSYFTQVELAEIHLSMAELEWDQLNLQTLKIIIIRSGTTIDKSALPVTLTPSGLSQERKQYTFDPSVMKNTATLRALSQELRIVLILRAQNRPNSQELGPSTKRSKRLCTHCRMPVHTKTVKGQMTCPTLLKECPQ